MLSGPQSRSAIFMFYMVGGGGEGNSLDNKMLSQEVAIA